MAAPIANLVRYFSVRYLARRRLRTLLGFVAVALGIALYVSADVANTSVIGALEHSGKDLAGKAQWHVMKARGVGIEEEAVERVRAISGAIAAPVIQASAGVVVPKPASLMILGIDFRSDATMRLYSAKDGKAAVDPAAVLATLMTPNAILLSRPFAEDAGLRTGQKLVLDTPSGRKTFVLTGILEPEGAARALDGGIGIIDIACASRVFRKPGLVDRIEVAGVSREALTAALPDLVVESAERPNTLVEDALARLRSLVAVSVIAVLVGIFIIYNTVAISVVERLKEIGTLRAIGASRGQIQRTLLAEWMIVGLFGSAFGVLFGWALAKALVQYTATTLNALMPIADIKEIILKPSTIVVAHILGVGATLAAAWFPARKALEHSPVAILRAYTYRFHSSYLRAFFVGVFCLVGGALLIYVLRRYATIGLVSTAVFFVGLALVLPQLTIWAAHVIRPFFAKLFRIEGFLAADNVAKFPQRTALTVIALGGALAMMVASATLIAGFRTACQRWLDHVLPFDLSISSTDLSRSVYSGNLFPPSIEDELRKDGLVEFCYGVRVGFTGYRDKDVMVLAIEFDKYKDAQARTGDTPWTRRFRADPTLLEKLQSGGYACVSENFRELYGPTVGDSIEMTTVTGKHALKILHTVEDYSWPRGVIVLDLAAYRRFFDDRNLTYVDVILKPGTDIEAARAALTKSFGGAYSLFAFKKKEILKIAADTLDQTMALANIQVLIALFIGFLGIFNTLLISVLQRTREVGLLRAIGMSRSQIARTVVMESLLIAVVGGIVGVIVGIAGGWYPLRLFTLNMTGYLSPAVVPWTHVVMALALSLAIGLGASFLPARRAARLNVLDAIGYE